MSKVKVLKAGEQCMIIWTVTYDTTCLTFQVTIPTKLAMF